MSGATIIPERAFAKQNHPSFSIASSIESIGMCCFAGYLDLSEITLIHVSHLKIIGFAAFFS
jgi:hypothetical protein